MNIVPEDAKSETKISNLPVEVSNQFEEGAKKYRSILTLAKPSNTTIGVQAHRSCFTLKSLSRLKDIHHEKPALWICKIIVGYPKLTLGITTGLHLSSLIITLILMWNGYDIVPMHFNSLPLDIRTDTHYLRGLAWLKKDVYYTYDNQPLSELQEQGSVVVDAVDLIFEPRVNKPGSNVFSTKNMEQIAKVINSLDGNSTYCEKIGPYCMPPIWLGGLMPNLKNMSSNQREVLLAQIFQTTRNFDVFRSKKSIISNSTQSKITRAFFKFGAPIKGYTTIHKERNKQIETIFSYIVDNWKSKLENIHEQGTEDLNVYYNSLALFKDIIDYQVKKDMMWAIGSAVFMFFFMLLQTGSMWITCISMLSICTSFTFANLIYRVILDNRYFGAFHVLSVFIILAIGADDTFVFFDTWKLSNHFNYPTLEHRLSNCYRKAGLAMLFTSVTTAVAFGLSAISPFLGISTFGSFSALLVFVNYVSVVTHFPAVVVTYHLYWENKIFLCFGTKEDSIKPTERYISSDPEDASHILITDYPMIEFFRGPFYRFIVHKYYKWIIMGFFFTVIPVSLYFTSTLSIDEERMKFMGENNNFGKHMHLSEKALGMASSKFSKVNIVWGLQTQSLRECHPTNLTCFGRTKFDKHFDLNINANQFAIKKLCKTLKSMKHRESFGIRNSKRGPEISCFINSLEDFLKDLKKITQSKKDVYKLPIDRVLFDEIRSKMPEVFPEKLKAGNLRYFDAIVSLWQTVMAIKSDGTINEVGLTTYRGANNGTLPDIFIPKKKSYHYNSPEMLLKQRAYISKMKSFHYPMRLRWAAIRINLTFSDTMLYPEGIIKLGVWEKMVSKEIDVLPEGLNRGFQTAIGPNKDDGSMNIIWHWMRVQETLTNSAFIGIIVGLCTAFPILIFATMNIIVALMALMTIIFITFSVIAMIPLLGWKLGVLESLNLVLLVGLAVEFVIHLSEAYARSEKSDRLARTEDVLTEVGFSVLSGAFSSLGASFFLLLAKILFLVEFGVFMFCTVGISIIYSLLFFTTILGIIGPQDRFGNVSAIPAWIHRYRFKRQIEKKNRELLAAEINSRTINKDRQKVVINTMVEHSFPNGNIDLKEDQSSSLTANVRISKTGKVLKMHGENTSVKFSPVTSGKFSIPSDILNKHPLTDRSDSKGEIINNNEVSDKNTSGNSKTLMLASLDKISLSKNKNETESIKNENIISSKQSKNFTKMENSDKSLGIGTKSTIVSGDKSGNQDQSFAKITKQYGISQVKGIDGNIIVAVKKTN